MISLVRAPEDLQLALQCAGGDRAAQRAVFQKYKRNVHACLYRILGSNHAIEDLVQEAFLSIFRSIGTFRGESTLATWIDRCTVRVAYGHIDMRTRRIKTSELVDDQAPDSRVSPEDGVLHKEMSARVYKILDHLEAEQRTAFALAVIDERPLQEVAEMMGATLEATKSRVFRARKYFEERAAKDPLLAKWVTEQGSERTVRAAARSKELGS